MNYSGLHFFTAMMLLFASAGFAEKVYDESNGYVVMEAENTESDYDGWDFHETDAAGYPSGATGSGHLEFMRYGSDGWGTPSSPLVYKFRIHNAGIYRLHVRAHKRLNAGDDGDKHNDCYIRMEGDFDVGSTNVTLQALSNDAKLYGGDATVWKRASNMDAVGADHTPAMYEFKADETYTLIISGRSNQFNADRILLYHDGMHGWPNDATLESLAESELSFDHVRGEKKLWHKVTLALDGPVVSETDALNPFSDYRYDVTFTHPDSGRTYTVPGYFAADGDAANTSSASGNQWFCHFRPDESGVWTYAISFRSGSNVAMGAAGGGSSVADLDGITGRFSVSADRTVTAPDLRAKGRLRYVNKHHLQFEGSGEYFLKFGPDSPENLLEYYEFDNTPEEGNKGSWHLFANHRDDYKGDGVLWKDTKGTNILGAVNYIASTGANSISMLLNNIGRTVVNPDNPDKTLSAPGDGARAFPFISTNVADRLRYDCSKLAQWEMVFDHAETKGLYLHFKLAETENARDLDIEDASAGNIGNERKLYYREMVARFGHHLALNWNLSEEIPVGSDTRRAWLEYLEEIDPWQNHRVFHTGPSYDKSNFYTPHLNDTGLTGVSLQTPEAISNDMVFAETLQWVTNSANAGFPWVVACDEQGPGNQGVNLSFDLSRKNVLWDNLMAGGGGVEYYSGGSDLTLDDYAHFEELLIDSNYAVNDFFYGENIPFWNMSNRDELLSRGAGHCLADDAGTVVVYLTDGGSATLDLSGQSGTFDVHWFDPRNGGGLQSGSVATVPGGSAVSLGTAPAASTDDWAVLVRRQGLVSAPVADAGADLSVDESVGQCTLSGSGADDGGIVSYAWNQVSGPAPAALSGQTTDFLTASDLVEGTYVFRLTVTDNDGFGARDDVSVLVTKNYDEVVSPDADAYVQQVSPATKAGTWKKLIAKNELDGDSKTSESFFRFDLSGLDSTRTLNKAVLRLKVISGASAVGNLQSVSDDSWEEKQIIWDNKPAAGATVGSASFITTVGEWYEVDVTDYAEAQRLGDGLCSLQLTTETTASVQFHSKEGDNPSDAPYLAVVYNAPIPKPIHVIDEDWESISLGDTTGINQEIADETYDSGLRLHNHILGEIVTADASFTSASGRVMQVTTGTNPAGGWGMLTADDNPCSVSLTEGQDIVFSFDAYVTAVPEGSGSINLGLKLFSPTAAATVSRAFSEFTGASSGDVIRVSWTTMVTAEMAAVTSISPQIAFEGLVTNFSTTGPNSNGTEIDVMQIDNIQLTIGLPPEEKTGFAKFEEDHHLTGGASGDDDGDGWSNAYEYGFGGNPTNAASAGIRPELSLRADGVAEFRHVMNNNPDVDITYMIEQSSNLTDNISWMPVAWLTVTTNSHAADGFDERVLETDTSGLPNRFFRLRVLMP